MELRRKLFHLFALLLWIVPIVYFPKSITLALFVLVMAINLLVVLRVGFKRLGWFYRFVLSLERPKNYQRPGIQALWANLGIFISYLISKEGAVAGVLVLAVGDAISGLAGQRWGKKKLLGKSLEGFLAFFLSSFICLLPFYGLWQTLVLAFVGAVTELLSGRIDDNFTVPICVSLTYTLFY
ncbi:diacylglycerol/polyprenol kinase family protein [Thermocrinis minervae]|uniref:Dolichol kinase n=1 Tax=Thermocrinis minervae TaxID=381751 RepID=A0A1M6SEB7_9AQUI|nr:diacylglycerol/polyprenol kinase family protein [Thermocrinis minervae]SHK42838.1 Dolichol kinase [Thermocrinis minervae]